MYCRNCGNVMEQQAVVCVKCGVGTGMGSNFCPNCGQQTQAGAYACTNCGIALQAPFSVTEQKSKLAAGLLGIFLGGLGIHNFYLGFTTKAVIQLVICLVGGIITCGIASVAMEIWGLIEGIMILTGKVSHDSKGVPLKE